MLSANVKQPTVKEAVSQTKVVTDSSTSLQTSQTMNRYYGINIAFADPVRAAITECVAVVSPAVGKQRVAQFVRQALHDSGTRQQQNSRQSFSALHASRAMRNVAIDTDGKPKASMAVLNVALANGRGNGKQRKLLCVALVVIVIIIIVAVIVHQQQESDDDYN